MLTQTLPAELPLAGEGGLSSQGETVTQLVYLDVVFDDANPDGVITGARPMYEDNTDVVAKGDIQIKNGDKIVPMYYKFDANNENDNDEGKEFKGKEYEWNDDSDITYAALSAADYYYGFNIEDVYGGNFITKIVMFTIDGEGNISFQDSEDGENGGENGEENGEENGGEEEE